MAFNKKYEVYDRGALLGQYYADEVSQLIGIPLRRVSAYAASGARFLRRYTIEEQKNRDTLNRMRQLLGQQRKEEEYLDGERAYKPRVGKG